jgi:rhomboid protease GluP
MTMPHEELSDLLHPPALPAPEILEFPIVPRRASSLSMVRQTLASTVVGTLLCAAMFGQGRAPDEMVWILGLAALFGLLLAWLVVRFLRQTPPPAVLRIEPEHVRWRSTAPGSEVALPYNELWVAHKEGRGEDEKLVFKKRGNELIAVSTAFLPEPRAADAALAMVHERVGDLGDGRQRLAGILARQAVMERIRSGRTIVDPAVSVLLGLVFLAELMAGALSDPIRLWTFGANSFSLVVDGQLFRLATANLLHGSVVHILFNIIALVSLGTFLEPLLGRGRFLSVLLASALAGAAGSALVGHHALSLGASTGIAGLVGAYVVILRRWPDRIANPPTIRTWIGIALAFLWPALIFNNIDHAAHLAGFLAGFVLLSLDTHEVDLGDLASRGRAPFRAAAALLTALFGVAGWMAFQHAKDPQRLLWDAAFLARDSDLSPEMRNNLSWHIVTRPDASKPHLWNALRGLESAVQDEPGPPAAYRDTLATAHYRLGHWEKAVVMEHEVLAEDRSPVHAAQLARFEWALLQARGPLVLEAPSQQLPRAEIVPGPAILLEPGEPQLPPGAKMHFILAREGKPSALLEVTAGASGASGPLRYALPGNLPFPLPDQVVLALVDPRPAEGPEETHWELLPIVPEVARLP